MSDSSTTPEAEAPVGVTAESPAAQQTPASPAEGVKEPSMLSTVLGALEKTDKASPADGSGNEPAPEADAAKAGDGDGEITEDELKHYSERAQKRIRHLAKQVRETDDFVKAARPKVETFDKILGYVESKGLSTEEVDFTFAVMGAVKTNPEQALEALRPVIAELERRVGVVLPPDLQEDVRLGMITQQRALELSQQRAKAERLEQTSAAQTERQQAAQQQEQSQRFIGAVHNSIAAWEQDKAVKDPDWSQKSPLVAERLELEFRRNPGAVRSPNDAVALARKIAADVDKTFRTIRPAPRSMTPVMGGGSPSPRSASQPSSIKDVINQTLGR
jgi:hypothetical protein